MSTNLQNLEYNQTFQYKDGTAKFLSKDSKSRVAWIEYNGQTIRVDYNYLFGINYAEEMKERNIAGIDERIASAQANYDEYSAKIEEAKITCKLETKKQDFITSAMIKLLGGRKDKSQLTGARATEYGELEAQLIASTKIGDMASSNIFSYAMLAFDEACYKHVWECQRSIAESMLG